MSNAVASEPLCIGCNYPLAQLPDAKCPECGRHFDLADPSSLNPTGRPIGPVSRFILAAPVWPLLFVYALSLPWYFWRIRHPHVSLSMAGFALLLFTCLMIPVPRLLQLIARATVRDNLGGGRWLEGLRPRWPAWPFVVTILIVTWMAGTHQWPLVWALNLSQPALDEFADKALTNPDKMASLAPAEVGLFHIESVEVRGRRVILYTKTVSRWANWGLVRNVGCIKDYDYLELSRDEALEMVRIRRDWFALMPRGWS